MDARRLAPLAMLAALTLATGCDALRSDDAKRTACLNDAALAPTASGVALAKNLCLLEHPLEPCRLVDGTYDANVVGCNTPGAQSP